MQVTLQRVVDPLSGGQYDSPSTGKRFIGAFIRLRNVGQAPYSDAPSNGATLISNRDEQADSTTVTEGPCSSEFDANAKIAPGETQVGCIPFEMQSGQRPAKFQFTLNSGFADQTGEWTVDRTLTGSPNSSSSSSAGSSSSGDGSQGITQCDPNISAGGGTTCPFAENVFKAYAHAYHSGEGDTNSVEATSPTTGRTYTMDCSNSGGTVSCSGGNNALVTFPLHAAAIY